MINNPRIEELESELEQADRKIAELESELDQSNRKIAELEYKFLL